MGGTLHAAWLGGSRTGVVAMKMARMLTALVPWTNFSHHEGALRLLCSMQMGG